MGDPVGRDDSANQAGCRRHRDDQVGLASWDGRDDSANRACCRRRDDPDDLEMWGDLRRPDDLATLVGRHQGDRGALVGHHRRAGREVLGDHHRGDRGASVDRHRRVGPAMLVGHHQGDRGVSVDRHRRVGPEGLVGHHQGDREALAGRRHRCRQDGREVSVGHHRQSDDRAGWDDCHHQPSREAWDVLRAATWGDEDWGGRCLLSVDRCRRADCRPDWGDSEH
jgi:hypothetical protein